MYFFLKISSKNKVSLNNFLFFIQKLKFPSKVIKNYPKPKKKKFLTVLKSPHVNKDAQEQFEFKIFSKEVMLWSPQLKLVIFIFKKVIKESFSGVQVKIFCLSDNKNNINSLLKFLNPYNLNFNFFKNRVKKQTSVDKKIKSYLDLSDCYGEITYKDR